MIAGIGRRQFISALGGAATWPLAAYAQAPPRRIGVLMALSGADQESNRQREALQGGLRELGWVDGKNVTVDFRWVVGDPQKSHALARELIAMSCDVIVTHATPNTDAVATETKTTPIVFVSVGDASKYIASVAKPEGNVTGFVNNESSVAGKWVELLKDIAPGVTRADIIYNPETSPQGGAFYLDPLKAAAAALNVTIVPSPCRSDDDIKTAVVAFIRDGSGGLIAMNDVFTGVHRDTILALAAQYRLPAVYPFSFFVRSGGLASYGVSIADLFRRAASYVDRILKGEKPGELPVQFPTKFELALNLKTAHDFDLKIRQDLLMRVDELIE